MSHEEIKLNDMNELKSKINEIREIRNIVAHRPNNSYEAEFAVTINKEKKKCSP